MMQDIGYHVDGSYIKGVCRGAWTRVSLGRFGCFSLSNVQVMDNFGRFDADNSGGIDLAEFGALWAHLNQVRRAALQKERRRTDCGSKNNIRIRHISLDTPRRRTSLAGTLGRRPPPRIQQRYAQHQRSASLSTR